jgi:hypothetical protein
MLKKWKRGTNMFGKVKELFTKKHLINTNRWSRDFCALVIPRLRSGLTVLEAFDEVYDILSYEPNLALEMRLYLTQLHVPNYIEKFKESHVDVDGDLFILMDVICKADQSQRIADYLTLLLNAAQKTPSDSLVGIDSNHYNKILNHLRKIGG